MRKILGSLAAISLAFIISSEKNIVATPYCKEALQNLSALMTNPMVYLDLNDFIPEHKTKDPVLVAAGKIDIGQVGYITHVSLAENGSTTPLNSALVILGEKNNLQLEKPIEISDGPFTHLEWVSNYGVFHLGTEGSDRVHQLMLNPEGVVKTYRLVQPFGLDKNNPKLIGLKGGGPGLSILWSFYDDGSVFEIASPEKKNVFRTFDKGVENLKVVSQAQSALHTFPAVQGISDGSIRLLSLVGDKYESSWLMGYSKRGWVVADTVMAPKGDTGISIYDGEGYVVRWRIEKSELLTDYMTKLEGYNPRIDPTYKFTGKPLLMGRRLVVPTIDKGRTYIDVFDLAETMSPRVVRWEMNLSEDLKILVGPVGGAVRISKLLLSPNGKEIVAVSNDGFLGVLNIEKLFNHSKPE